MRPKPDRLGQVETHVELRRLGTGGGSASGAAAMKHFGVVVAVLLACGWSARAYGGTATANAFVHGVYRDYGKPDWSGVLGEPAPDIFAPRLLGLIRADEKAAAGEVGRLDEDPLCDCQDDDGFRLSSVVVARQSGNRVVATVRFVIGVVPEVVALDLVTTRGGWRIADVHSRSVRSLVSFLEGGGTSEGQPGGFLVPPTGRR